MALAVETLVGVSDPEFASAADAVTDGSFEVEGAVAPGAGVEASGVPSSKPIFSTSFVANICSFPST